MGSGIARVVVDVALDREFDYEIPASLRDRVQLGSQVVVPFGPRRCTGYVVGLAATSEVPALKPIAALACDKPLFSSRMIELARWVSRYYCAPLEHAVRTLLPAVIRRRGVAYREQLFVSARKDALAPRQAQALRRKSPRQAAALDLLAGSGGMFLSEVARKAGTTPAAIRALEAKGLVEIAVRAMPRDPTGNRVFLRTEPLALMEQQAAALEVVKASIDRGDPPVVLLHGVTGSGKTEVYLQALAHALAQGKGAIVLVPEISLTPQTIERFRGRFGEGVAVLHSSLSDGERHDEWHRIHERAARIVVGARSAVFAPVADLGLIVVDEEHETSYKQDESPRYNARDVAVMRGRMEPCAVVLGSATPSLESYSNGKSGKYRLVSMPHRVDHRRMPAMRVVDMRVEAERSGRPVVFSRDLIELISLRLDRGEQVILFLNRRGYATSLVCPRCGYVAECSQCSIAFTYHRQSENLRCHICGATEPVPGACPKCGDKAFKYAGLGTQRLESVAAKCFPKASIRRMDSDSTSAKGSHEKILDDFRTGKIDILIGTQMIAKGLDLPNVTLIGVIYADLGLHVPDFRAGERTFQLLVQVAGRAGRGDVAGDVVVQTYTPFHPTIQAARRLDFEGFFNQEVESRRELGYPPFGRMTCLTLQGPDEDRVAAAADALAEAVGKGLSPDTILSGPAAAPLARAKGQYRYQLMVRGPSAGSLASAVRSALQAVRSSKGLTVAVDVDPLSLM